MRVLFMGTPQFAVPSLELIHKNFNVVGVVTQPDKPAGRGKRLTPPPVKELAYRLNLNVYQPEKAGELFDILKGLELDCIVVVAYGKILPKSILDLPPYGVINLHASLLPRYRGAAPIQRALMAGEKVTGNTVMLVNERMDAGDILSQEEVIIGEEDNFYTLSERLSRQGADLLVRTLNLWFRGSLKPVPQKEEEATYAPPVQREEYKLCWKAEAESVRDRVRGLYPNVYTYFRGERLKLLKVSVVEGHGEPGEIIDDGDFIVACGYGAVQILELISPKGKRMKGEDFMRGYSPRKGELLK
ncbi:methionyl-tRNA formyltransferase [Hydrogenivirga caldilitoris]|nr:methionyl-tRNA formyltransferase [Hydrogenivirga caldilitoris]